MMKQSVSPKPSATIGEYSTEHCVSEGLHFLLFRFHTFHAVLGATAGLERPDLPCWAIDFRVKGIHFSMQQLLMGILHSRKDSGSNLTLRPDPGDKRSCRVFEDEKPMKTYQILGCPDNWWISSGGCGTMAISVQ